MFVPRAETILVVHVDIHRTYSSGLIRTSSVRTSSFSRAWLSHCTFLRIVSGMLVSLSLAVECLHRL